MAAAAAAAATDARAARHQGPGRPTRSRQAGDSRRPARPTPPSTELGSTGASLGSPKQRLEPADGKGGPGGSKSPQGYGPYSGQESRGRRGGQGIWQGLQDVTAAARVALDTARELRSLGALAPAPALGQSPVTDSGGAGRGWLAAARGWLLGDLPDQQPALPPPFPLGLRACTATPTTRPCSVSCSGLTARGARSKTRKARRWPT